MAAFGVTPRFSSRGRRDHLPVLRPGNPRVYLRNIDSGQPKRSWDFHREMTFAPRSRRGQPQKSSSQSRTDNGLQPTSMRSIAHLGTVSPDEGHSNRHTPVRLIRRWQQDRLQLRSRAARSNLYVMMAAARSPADTFGSGIIRHAGYGSPRLAIYRLHQDLRRVLYIVGELRPRMAVRAVC